MFVAFTKSQINKLVNVTLVKQEIVKKDDMSIVVVELELILLKEVNYIMQC